MRLFRPSREGLLNGYSMLVGGTAGGAVATRQWLIACVATGAYLLLILDVPRVLLWLTARGYAGLSLVVPIGPLNASRVINEAQAKKNMRIAVESLRKAVDPCGDVQLLLASGFKVIGWDRDPGWLHAVLSNRMDRKVKVLLLDPFCASADERGSVVMKQYGADAYREGTKAVLWTLRRWRDDVGLDIDVRLYTEPPIWQMVLMERELWLLSTGQVASDFSPHFVLRRGTPYGLSWGLEAVFDRRWNHWETSEVDWPSVTAPDAAKVVPLPNIEWS